MKTTIGLLSIILGLASSAASQTAAQSQTAEKPATGSISGRITIDGQAAPEVAVMLATPGSGHGAEMVSSTKTDSEGRFHLTDVAAGKYLIGAFAPAHAGGFDRTSNISISDGQHVEGIEINLVLGGVITGRILDRDGKPAVGQTVQAVSAEAGGRLDWSSFDRHFSSDDRGVYRIYGLPPGRYMVRVGIDIEHTHGTSGRNVLPLTFHPGVTDQSKAAIVKVESGSEIAGIDIVFGKPRTLFEAKGQVVEAETGRPIAGARIDYGQKSKDGSSWGSGTNEPTDAKGFFKVRSLLPGKYYVSAQLAGSNRYCQRVEFEIKDSDVSDLSVPLYEGSTISGVVQAEAGVDRDVLAKLELLVFGSGASTSGHVQMSPDGRFTAVGTPPGDVRIVLPNDKAYPGLVISRVDHPRARVQVPEWGEPVYILNIQPREQVTDVRVTVLQFKGGIRGSVKFTGGNLPLDAFLSVDLWRTNSRAGGELPEVEVDANGRFETKGLSPGEYRVEASIHSRSAKPSQTAQPTNVEKTVTVTTNVEEIELVIDVSKLGK